jgi:pyruvate kinase
MGRTLHGVDMLRGALDAGARGVRLALGIPDRDHRADFAAAVEAGTGPRRLAVYLDLPATRPRTGSMPSAVFKKGAAVSVIDAKAAEGRNVIPLPGLREWLPAISPGDRLVFRDGRNVFRVTAREACSLAAECVVSAGALEAGHGCLFPDSGAAFEVLRPADRALLEGFAQAGLRPDGLLLSLVNGAEPIKQARQDLAGVWDPPPRFIAKIETAFAVQHLDAILAASDGVLLGRGDLGLSLRPETLPRVQAEAAEKAHAVGKPFAIATQFLEQFAAAGVPNRAELNDVALAVRQGAQAVLLCQETNNSPRPLDCIRLAQAIIAEEAGARGSVIS